MHTSRWIKSITVVAIVLTCLLAVTTLAGIAAQQVTPTPRAVQDTTAAGSYIVLGWNDLGMHCYNNDFADMAILPPYNTLWAQVLKAGNLPQVVTTGLTLEYSFPDNTYSVGKSNFWDYVEHLFGSNPGPNIGLTGKGLTGAMDVEADHFQATGIPLTEYRDQISATVTRTRLPWSLCATRPAALSWRATQSLRRCPRR